MTKEQVKAGSPTPVAQSLEPDSAVHEAVVAQLREAAGTKKCWPCGCLHTSLTAIERAFADEVRPKELDLAIREARGRLVETKYDCLGCEVCYPALAVNVLSGTGGKDLVGVETCPTGNIEERTGWPPLPGSYTVLRYRAPVAVCTLTDEYLMQVVAQKTAGEIALVGTLQTENLGIERLIKNVLANPNIRFLVVCGPDSRQAVGHLPGQSLVALARCGVDERGQIMEARGRRPVIRNLSRAAVEHFRRTVEVFDLVGTLEFASILQAVVDNAKRNPGPAEPFEQDRVVPTIPGYVPERMVSDPAGYFVIFIDRPRGLLSLEHYRNDGLLDCIIEGHEAAELYFPAIERGLVSRLDHAAYLGRELARAECALQVGEPYVQDAAPERLKAPAEAQICAPGCARE